MPGKLVDVGSYRLHIDCLGAGSPTVVLENGSGDSMLEWMSVQPEIAKFARVCAYDRAGLGWSDPDSAPRTTEGVTRDLHALLANAGIAPPYVLVGHSMGGFFVSRYAAQYPDEVVGAVLVDPAGPGQNKIFPAEFMRAIDPFYFHDRIASLTAPMGLPRIMGWCSPDYAPPQYRSQLAMVDCAPKTFDAAVAEDDYRKNGADDLSQWPAQGSLGNIPTIPPYRC
jgi:pimeloyl-ACP methyl ester carboxylesterase